MSPSVGSFSWKSPLNPFMSFYAAAAYEGKEGEKEESRASYLLRKF